MTINTAYKEWVANADESILVLDKAEAGKVSLDDIHDSLNEYKRLFKAGIASPAEIVTLSRAYPEISKYANVVDILDLTEGNEPVVVGGPASVELVDREGHLITSEALEGAFKKYMENFRTRNVMVMHSDVQVGHALPAYISKSGQIFKSGVNDTGLFFIAELRNDTKIAKKVGEQINTGKMKSYSIAGSATKTQNIEKGANTYMQVDEMELAEVTICEKGVNQGAHFELMKAMPPSPPEDDGTIYVISKEDVPTFKEIFDSWVDKAESAGILEGKQIAVLQNQDARLIQHRALLDEMGFPAFVYPEDQYRPVDYDDPEDPTDWRIVNQAGQDLGDPNEEEMKIHKATDIFKRVLTAEAPDETWTGQDREKPVQPRNSNVSSMEKTSSVEFEDPQRMLGVAKANGATALATQHNNPDNKRPKVQNMLKSDDEDVEKIWPLLAAGGAALASGAGAALGAAGAATGAALGTGAAGVLGHLASGKIQNEDEKEDTKLEELEKFLPLLAAVGRGLVGIGGKRSPLAALTGAMGGDDEESD